MIKTEVSTQYNIFKNESCWLKADFHLHKNVDAEFAYDGESHDFVRQYVGQLKAQEIGIGIITNHNKFDKGEFISLRKKAKKKGLDYFRELNSH